MCSLCIAAAHIVREYQVETSTPRSIDRFDQRAVVLARRVEHEVGHVFLVARMADADAQAPEIRRAELRDDVPQAVVARMAAAVLDFHRPRRQVELVVRDQDFVGRDLVELRQRATAMPDSFIQVCGMTSQTRPGAAQMSVESGLLASARTLRAASRSTSQKPALWRSLSCLRPGCPGRR